MTVSRYQALRDEAQLMRLLEDEDEEWSCYWAAEHSANYRQALAKSLTYVCREKDELVGYSRSLDDCGFYIYVCDLLVRRDHRSKHFGRALLEILCADFPRQTVYVMSDVDPYYLRQGYRREGSIFEVTPSQ